MFYDILLIDLEHIEILSMLIFFNDDKDLFFFGSHASLEMSRWKQQLHYTNDAFPEYSLDIFYCFVINSIIFTQRLTNFNDGRLSMSP